MQLDRKKLDRLLEMNDEQLTAVIQSIARDAGIDPALLGLNPQNIQSVRQALGGATDSDLQQLNQIYDSYRQNRQKP